MFTLSDFCKVQTADGRAGNVNMWLLQTANGHAGNVHMCKLQTANGQKGSMNKQA